MTATDDQNKPADWKVADTWGDETTGEWEVGLRLKNPPKPPEPKVPKLVKPDVSVDGPERDRRSPRVRWASDWKGPTFIVVVLILVGVWNYYSRIEITAKWDQANQELQLMRADRATPSPPAENPEVAALREALAEANRRLEEAAKAADEEPAAAEPTLPASVLSGDFTIYADTENKRVYLGKFATAAHRVQANEMKATRGMLGEIWTVFEPWRQQEAEKPTAPPAEFKPPAGSVVVTESELRALRQCRQLLIEWQQTGAGAVHWRLADHERAARDAAIAGERR